MPEHFSTQPYTKNPLEEGRVKVIRPMEHHDILPTLIMIAEEAEMLSLHIIKNY